MPRAAKDVKEQELEEIKRANRLGIAIQASEDAEYLKDRQHALEVPEKVEYLLKKMKPIDITLPERPAELWEYAIRAFGEVSTSTARAGFALLMLKEMTPHGKFAEELQAREIPERTAQNAMSVARLLLKLPKSKAQTLSVLNGSKLIELARIPEETFEDIMQTEKIDGKPLDELDRMSVRELKATIRKLKNQHAKELDEKRKDLERKDKDIVKLSSEIEEMKATELPPDEAEEAALAKLDKIRFNFDMLIGSIMMAKFHDASPKVMVRAFHLCEYMEYSCRFEATKIRHTNGQVWQDAWANENEVVQAQQEMWEKADKLPDANGKNGLK